MDANRSAKSSSDFSDISRCSARSLAKSTHAFNRSSSDFVRSVVLGADLRVCAAPNLATAILSTASIADLRLSTLEYSNSFLRADSAIATPSTIPTSSSSRMSVSCAASSNSDATWKETDTDRSLPMDVRAPREVPPAPTNCCPAISQLDAQKAARVAYELIRPTLLWQLQTNTQSLVVQRLWLETFTTASRPQGERKRIRCWDTLHSIGTTFGVTLGQILAHVARPKEPHTRLLRAIRDELIKVASHHKNMSGDDALLLGYGLASCSVLRNQHRKLRGASLRIDTRYGNSHAAIGACTAIIVTHAVLARFEKSAPAYFMEADNLRTTLRTADERLAQWSTRHSGSYVDTEALGAEQRALRRAYIAIDAAMSRAEVDTVNAIDRLQEQLATATIAAYPPQRVAHDNQAEMEALAHGGAFLPQRTSTRSPRLGVQQTLVVPLSGIPGIPNTATDGVNSPTTCSSASWITTNTSSVCSDTSSSEFELIQTL